MIRILLSVLICLCFTSIDAKKPEKLAKKWLYAITSDKYSGRMSGTEGGKEAFEYIKKQVSSMGYKLEIDSFKYKNVTLRNIIVPTGNVKDTVIVVGAHYDGQHESNSLKKYPAADDNASGVVTVLLLLQKFKSLNIPPHYPILFCFWDGEEYCYGEAFKGSRHFVENNNKVILYYINIDTIGHDHDQTNTMSFLYWGEDILSKINEILKNNSFKFRYFKAAKGKGESDQISFEAKDISYVSFYDSPAYKHKGCGHDLHSVNDIPEAISINRMVRLSDLVFNLVTKY